MAGSFSFLPLSNKPGLQARASAQQQNVDQSQKPRMLPEQQASSSEVEMNDKGTHLDPTQGRKRSIHELSDNQEKRELTRSEDDECVVTVKKVSSNEEATLLPYMPPLFGTDLPPCNAEVQVAYGIINSKLRQRWLNSRGHASAVDVCKAIKEELSQQNTLWPPFSLKGPFKRRKPWCRETVFKYQMYWIEYFNREAQTLEPMTESEIMDRKKQASVPRELRFNVVRSDISRLWDEWHQKKRAKTPVLPGFQHEHVSETYSPKGETGQEVNNDIDPIKPSSSSVGTFSSPPAFDGAEDDAHLWAQSDHD